MKRSSGYGPPTGGPLSKARHSSPGSSSESEASSSESDGPLAAFQSRKKCAAALPTEDAEESEERVFDEWEPDLEELGAYQGPQNSPAPSDDYGFGTASLHISELEGDVEQDASPSSEDVKDIYALRASDGGYDVYVTLPADHTVPIRLRLRQSGAGSTEEGERAYEAQLSAGRPMSVLLFNGVDSSEDLQSVH